MVSLIPRENEEGILQRRRPRRLQLGKRRAAPEPDDESGDEDSFPHSSQTTTSAHNGLPSPITPTGTGRPNSTVTSTPANAAQTSTASQSISSISTTRSMKLIATYPNPTSTSTTLTSSRRTRTSEATGRSTASSTLSSTISSTTLPKATSTTIPILPEPQAIDVGERPPGERTRAHTTLSHDATIALEVIGIITGVALWSGLFYLFYKRLRRKRGRKNQDSNPSPPHSPAAVTFVSSGQASNSITGRMNQLRAYLTPNNEKNARSTNVTPVPNSVVGRTQRLDLVKPELLSEKSKNGTFMQGHQRSLTHEVTLNPPPSMPSIYTPAQSVASELQEPRKAFLKRNTLGKMVLGSRPDSTAEDEEKLIQKGVSDDDTRTFVHSRNASVPLVKDSEGRTKPLTGWRAKLFWPSDKRNSSAWSESTTQGVKKDDPTLISGGLRASGMTKVEDEESGVLGRMAGANMGIAENDGINPGNNGGTLKGLEGLRRGDALIERGVDRQSFVSGMLEGSRTTWGTNVWERLDAERELREVRERMEGGLGGEVQLNGRESSVARYRRPVSWIQDQAERRPPLPELPAAARRE